MVTLKFSKRTEPHRNSSQFLTTPSFRPTPKTQMNKKNDIFSFTQ